MSDNALELSGLQTGYDQTVILRDLTLEIPAGEVTALLGPNGAGKSTLLRAISGFLPATRGSITLFGEDVTTTPPHKRFGLGLCHVPEGRGVFRSLTVRENLALQAGRGRGRTAAAVERATAAFPILGERLAQPAGTLSGGQQQMLAMAAAYVRNPRLVLVDEASLGLAPIVVDEIFAFLARLTDEGGALLLVDQFATRALGMASGAYVLRRGEIVYRGTAKELLTSDVFAAYVGSATEEAASVD
ncbi:ABC transporter ATP-binding protein [Cryptosporangium sp. NPDC051539]|uniref:ABC transporter ATP-binding protein n=1 Tax=Cryptosporangium sp. NPDC051539 TaxID=3363962 RepID=UPI0037A93247